MDGIGLADLALLGLFMLGIYTGIEYRISPTVPVPSVLSGISGLILLWRRRDAILPAQLMTFLGVILVFLASILSADDLAFLPKRFTGLVQITYSLVIGYAVFLTVVRAERSQVAMLFFVFCVLILAGALLEDYGGLQPISDAVRQRLYDPGQIYDADLRDLILYGRVRPKVFTSEPSAVTFGYTLFAFIWLVLSTWRVKLVLYLALMGVGFIAMPGPTLLLMVLLLIPYALLATMGWGSSFQRALAIGCIAAFLTVAFAAVGESLFAARIHEYYTGQDASFFYRVVGPALVAGNVVATHPIAGAGLTGEPYIADTVVNVFMRSPEFDPSWQFENIGSVITNYVWLHWIYLGLVWGTIAIAAITFWLKVLGVPSASFCWIAWVILGQASGAYVGPKTWAVLFLAAASAVVASRQRIAAQARDTRWMRPAGNPRVAPASLETAPRW
jgi:hypothetical protein